MHCQNNHDETGTSLIKKIMTKARYGLMHCAPETKATKTRTVWDGKYAHNVKLCESCAADWDQFRQDQKTEIQSFTLLNQKNVALKQEEMTAEEAQKRNKTLSNTGYKWAQD